MARRGARALAIDLGPGIGAVDLQVLDGRARYNLDAASGVAAGFQSDKDLVLDLHIPRVVVFAGLDHGTRRRHAVTPPLHFDRVEIWPITDVIGGIALTFDQIAGFEVDEPIRTGPYRFEVSRCFARIGAFVRLEQMPRDDHAVRADEGVGPERRRFFKPDPYGERIDL